MKKVSRTGEPVASGVKSHRAIKYNADRKAMLDMATRQSISRDQRESSFLRCVEE